MRNSPAYARREAAAAVLRDISGVAELRAVGNAARGR
jgi:hypothetical protein